MNYELAKKLKDAGFPQDVKKGEMLTGEECERCGNHVYYSPSLSELIEACGKNFAYLVPLRDPENGDIVGWCAKDWREKYPIEGQHEGETPEEAVAHLWLILNK